MHSTLVRRHCRILSQSASLLFCYAALWFWRTPERAFPFVQALYTVALGDNGRRAVWDPTARHVGALRQLPDFYFDRRRCNQDRNRPICFHSAIEAPSVTAVPQSCCHLCEARYRPDKGMTERSPGCFRPRVLVPVMLCHSLAACRKD